jgi:MFS family permease
VRIGPVRAPLPRQVRLLVAARAVNQLGAFSLAFLTVLMCRTFGASLTVAGVVAAAFGLATIPSRLLGGRLAERLGRRRTIVLGMTGCAAAQLGLATAPDLAVAAFCAVLLGLAFELYEPPSQAMIADAVPPAGRASAYGMLTTALAVGNLGAGLVAAIVGRSGLRWLFAVDAATCLACALIAHLALPADRPQPPGLPVSPGAAGPGAHAASRPLRGPSGWQDRALLMMTAAGTIFALTYMTMLMALPLSLAADGVNPASAGLVMAASTGALVLARPLLTTGPLARLSSSAAFVAGYFLLGLGLAGYATAHSLAAYFLPAVAWSIGNQLLMGRAFAVVSDLAPAGATARYLAVYGLSWGIATVAAPVFATGLIAWLGPAALWTASSGLCFLMAVLQPWLLRSIAAHRRNSLMSLSRAGEVPG